MTEEKFVKIFYESQGLIGYDLTKTLECNQSFRWMRLSPGEYNIAFRNRVCHAKQEDGRLMVEMPESQLGDFGLVDWLDHLGVTRNGSSDDQHFYDIMHGSRFLKAAYECAKGLRLMRQDPWECTLCYILSQNSNVPRIRDCVQKLSFVSGKPIGLGFYAMPGPSDLVPPVLKNKSFGYREAYIYAISRAVQDWLDLSSLEAPKKTLDEALVELMAQQGIGHKVASCIALFSLGHTEAWPVDTWINKAMVEGKLTFSDVRRFGRHAGLVQEYIYYYMTHRDQN